MQDTKRRGRIRGLVGLARRGRPDARAATELVAYRPPALPAPNARTRLIGHVTAPLRWSGVIRAPDAPVDLLGGLLRGFGAFVLLPTAIVALYLFAFASDQYVSEARFAARGSVEHASSLAMAGPMASVAGRNNNQDAYIVAEYVESPAIIASIAREVDIGGMFSRSEADFWTRFDPAQPLEELTKYWRRHVAVRGDPISGIITLEVRAFTPGDAQTLARHIVARAEALVNDISRRAQNDAVERNRDEVNLAEERLRRAHVSLQEYRNRWGIIDPAKTAEATSQTLLLLERERLKLDNDLRVLRETLDEKARSIQTIVATLAGMNAQIAKLKDDLTNADVKAPGAPNVTQAILEYEGLQIERTIAEKLYDSAQAMFDRARALSQRQLVYLVTFVPPTLPEASIYPLRGSALGITFFCFFLLWSIYSLIAAGVRDHRL